MPELRARSKLVPPGSAGNGFERGCRDVEGETPKSCIPPRDCRSFIERFRFERVGRKVQFSYDPIKPSESGSGTYNGGPPSSGVLTSEQVENLERHLAKLEEKSQPAPEPGLVKGTLVLSIESGAGTRIFEFRPEAIDDFEAFLAALRSQYSYASFGGMEPCPVEDCAAQVHGFHPCTKEQIAAASGVTSVYYRWRGEKPPGGAVTKPGGLRAE